jgi:hypothetical protein
MSIRRRFRVNALWALLICSPAAFADSGCDAPLVQAIGDVRGLVESLREDKPSQSRIVAQDGSVYSAGQARWLRQQLQLIDGACVRGAEVEAAWRIEAMLDSLKPRPSTFGRVRDRCQASSVASEWCALESVDRGRRTVKVEPTPSRLSTSILPP